MMTLGWQRGDELLAQLHELLILPSSPATTVTVESGGPHACDGRRRRRCQRGSKRARDDDNNTNNGVQQGEEPRCSSSAKRRSKKQGSTSFVTPVPDFDGYRWRKYGQKQIEGAMYARSYYRCKRSAEQGCPAKRTVQRNDDGGAAATKYTVVYMGEHTCTATDSMEAPVILETTAVVAPDTGTSKRPEDDSDDTFTSAGSCSTTTTTTRTGIESPAISDITWVSSSIGGDYVVDDYGAALFAVHDSWAPAPSLQEMEDFTGPIRSPVHVPADGWTIDHFLLQLVNNEPVSHFSSSC